MQYVGEQKKTSKMYELNFISTRDTSSSRNGIFAYRLIYVEALGLVRREGQDERD